MGIEVRLREVQADFAVGSISGSLDLSSAPVMEKSLLEGIGQFGEFFYLVLNLENLDFIDSSGLAALVRIRRVLHSRNGKIALVCAKTRFKRIFEITGIGKLFRIYENEKQAINAMDETVYKESVLLIEDNPGFRLLFRDELEHRGYVVWEAEDGESGLKFARSKQPDLILLDLMIPKLHGLEVLKQIKAEPTTKRLRVVILSVVDNPQDMENSIASGADDYIVKGSDSIEGIIKRSCRLLVKA